MCMAHMEIVNFTIAEVEAKHAIHMKRVVTMSGSSRDRKQQSYMCIMYD